MNMIDEYIYSMTSEDWEFFAADCLCHWGYEIIERPARGADGGKDAVVAKNGKIYIVSCKHYKPKLPSTPCAPSITPHIEQDIFDRIIQHGANGFIGFYSTTISQALQNRFGKFKSCSIEFDIKLFDINEIRNKFLNKNIPYELLIKYDKKNLICSSNKFYPLHVREENYLPLNCLFCGKDILLEENVRNSIAQISDIEGFLFYLYGCKACLHCYAPEYIDWLELHESFHNEYILNWNKRIEKDVQLYKKKSCLSPWFYENKSNFEMGIRQRLIKWGEPPFILESS